MVYSLSVKNFITLGKLMCLLLSYSLPFLTLLSVNVHTKNTKNELTCLVMGTVFLVMYIDVYICIVRMLFLPFDP